MPDDSKFCSTCGAAAVAPIHTAPTSEGGCPPYAAPAPMPVKKSRAPLIIGILAACFILVIGSIFAVNEIGKANLRKQLLRDWSRVESEAGTYYTLELDFSEDEIAYNFLSFYYDTNIASMDYKVISPNKIEVDGYTYRLEFNDDKTMFTIYPALTSSDYSENWFHLE